MDLAVRGGAGSPSISPVRLFAPHEQTASRMFSHSQHELSTMWWLVSLNSIRLEKACELDELSEPAWSGNWAVKCGDGGGGVWLECGVAAWMDCKVGGGAYGTWAHGGHCAPAVVVERTRMWLRSVVSVLRRFGAAPRAWRV